MKKIENKVTNKVTLSSQNDSSGCELIVNQMAVTTMNISDMRVPLRNKQGLLQKLQFIVTNSGFVHSLFAHYALFFRFKSEGTAFKLNPINYATNSVISNNIQF